MNKDFLEALGLVIAVVTLLFTALKARRDGEEHARDLLRRDIELLESLQPGSHHYDRVNASAAKRADRLYLQLKPYFPTWWRLGLMLYLAGGAAGLYYGYQQNYWSFLFFVLAAVGFIMQRRSLSPDFSGNPPPVVLRSQSGAARQRGPRREVGRRR